MIRLYRVLRRRFAHAPFDGEGAFRYGGRWSSAGVRLTYASEHESLALLEYLAHLDECDAPEDLVLAQASVPDSVSRESIAPANLPPKWQAAPAPASLAGYGDEFARRNATCLLLVPSALAPSEHNCLINPAHSDFARLQIEPVQRLEFDPRLARRGSR